jgi:hypothetical protein
MTFFSRLACLVAAAAIFTPGALTMMNTAAPMFA